MRKAKKKVHPMPKLGWKDMLLYWSGMLLTGSGTIMALIIPLRIRDDIAFVNTDVVASTILDDGVHFLWLMLWLITVCCLIVVLYRKRIPVFGRSDIKYGPPAYPRIFPLFMKNKPQYWVSPKKVAFQKAMLQIGTAVMALWLFVAVLLYPNALLHRADLYHNGSIVIMDGSNHEEQSYRYGDVESAHIGTDCKYYGKSNRRHWYIQLTFTMKNGERIIYDNRDFRGDWEEILQFLLMIKKNYAGMLGILDSENLQEVVDYYDLTAQETELLYQLFE